MEATRQKKLVDASCKSAARLSRQRSAVAVALDTSKTNSRFQQAAKPASLAGGMKKAGVALLVAPDPFTDVAGAALLAGHFAMKRREPAGFEQLANETRKLIKDLRSLSI